jgi:branched-chain amino acid transport system ATP-binding protein
VLRLTNVACGYGLVRAVNGVSLDVPAGRVVALLGPNGAGKSSIIQCIAGHVELFAGEISYNAERIDHLPAAVRVGKGIAVSPEGRRLFSDLTVEENLILGGYCRPKRHTITNMTRVLDLFPRLRERLHSKAALLSGGEQQMTAIGRALMSEPTVLMIDELSLGLMPKMVDVCYEAVENLKAQQLSILIVEQNTQRALSVSDTVYVLQSGAVVWSGSSSAAQNDSDLMQAFLGIQ